MPAPPARRFAGFDDKIVALYARGMTVREIQAFLADMYAVEVSPDLIRHSLDFATWKVRKELAATLRTIYTALNADLAAAALGAFAAGPWGAVSRDRRELATRLAAGHSLLRLPPDVRKVLYTTNALESVHACLRKILKTRGHLPTDEAATKLIWLSLRNITATWGKEANFCRQARNQFAIVYGDRFTAPVMP